MRACMHAERRRVLTKRVGDADLSFAGGADPRGVIQYWLQCFAS
jgi:hypothetical protein